MQMQIESKYIYIQMQLIENSYAKTNAKSNANTNAYTNTKVITNANATADAKNKKIQNRTFQSRRTTFESVFSWQFKKA